MTILIIKGQYLWRRKREAFNILPKPLHKPTHQSHTDQFWTKSKVKLFILTNGNRNGNWCSGINIKASMVLNTSGIILNIYNNSQKYLQIKVFSAKSPCDQNIFVSPKRSCRELIYSKKSLPGLVCFIKSLYLNNKIRSMKIYTQSFPGPLIVWG